jgi:pimeloyl-ACP methyl ester carboxylesterase
MNDALTLLRIALWAVGIWLTVVWACGAGYVAVTYIEAVRHIPKRSLADTLRSVLRECWCILWTQPLLPLFQFAGKRLGEGRGSGGTPIVLVHGYFQNRVDFLYLAKRLRAAGSGPLYGCNFFWPQPFETSSVSVRDFVEQIRKKTGAEKVDLLTHSSGGLLALDLLHEKPEWVRRVAVIAVPWRGSPGAARYSAHRGRSCGQVRSTRGTGLTKSSAVPCFLSTRCTTTSSTPQRLRGSQART